MTDKQLLDRLAMILEQVARRLAEAVGDDYEAYDYGEREIE
jgi:hypothetical protein